MPNYDSGAYFLTTLIPVSFDTIPVAGSGGEIVSGSSPVHALREALVRLPTAQQSLARELAQSPFARNKRTHFARFVVIDDVAYNGRESPNAVLTTASQFLPRAFRIDPVVAHPQDHLRHPFLLFSADFDAKSGDDSERDAYLEELWFQAGDEFKQIFQYCYGFNERVSDPASFAKYVAQCQIETTMPFHDYFMDGVPLKSLPTLSIWRIVALFAGTATGGGFLVSALLSFALLPGLLSLLACPLGVLAGIAAGTYVVNGYVTAQGRKAFPPAPDATLPEVLKALYLQRVFTRFAIDHQLDGIDPEGTGRLYASFQKFIEERRPQDVEGPTQEPGVIGI